MKSDRLYKLIMLIVFVLIVFGIYKILLLNYFKQSDTVYKEIFNKVTDIEITSDTSKQNDSVGNLKYYIPSNLKLASEEPKDNQKTYYEYDKTGKQIGRLTIGLAEDTALEDTKKVLKYIDYEKAAKEYNITDEIDLYHYYYEHKDEKRNILSSSSQIKIDGFVKKYLYIVSSGSPSCNSYFLNQDMKGYMIECPDNNSYTAYFVNGKDKYAIYYIGQDSSFMTYKEFIKILESISIGD